jgi:Tfp pilus assembly protein PilO
MDDSNNKEIVEVLKDIKKQLESIQYDLADIKREMPKVPYYGDLLQDIEKAVRETKPEAETD